MELSVKKDLLGMSFDELTEFMLSLNEPKFRAKQLFEQMHKGLSPDDMTNISKATCKKLEDAFAYYYLPKPELKLVSKLDGTKKYLFALADGNCVESVVMKYEHGNTICISSQVGCRMGCAFCASTIGGKVRDLTPSEMIGQIISAEKDSGEKISNIVMMGIGEPLDNYDNVVKFLHLVNDPNGINIGYRHISISSCGLVDKIHKLAREALPITLSISLHAADDATRSKIMPINKKWNIDALLDACRAYYSATGRRISFEYTLISGENDSDEAAKKLSVLLNSKLRAKEPMPIHVNLIPVNKVSSIGFTPSDKTRISRFCEVLEKNGIRATVRRTLGSDINASCGQLRRNSLRQI